jgi:heme exporter protein D
MTIVILALLFVLLCWSLAVLLESIVDKRSRKQRAQRAMERLNEADPEPPEGRAA